jgi:hypothetical protein
MGTWKAASRKAADGQAKRLDPEETRFRLRLADEALSQRGTKRRMEEAQRVLRRVRSGDLPPGEPRDRYLWLQRAFAQYEAGEPVSSTGMKWIRQQITELRQLLPAGDKKMEVATSEKPPQELGDGGRDRD